MEDPTDVTRMSLREYMESKDVDWQPSGRPSCFELYFNDQLRFIVHQEKHEDIVLGLDRFDAAAERDIDISERDVQEFAQEFMSTIGQHMSVHTLSLFIRELTQELDRWKQGWFDGPQHLHSEN